MRLPGGYEFGKKAAQRNVLRNSALLGAGAVGLAAGLAAGEAIRRRHQIADVTSTAIGSVATRAREAVSSAREAVLSLSFLPNGRRPENDGIARAETAAGVTGLDSESGTPGATALAEHASSPPAQRLPGPEGGQEREPLA